MREIFNGTLIFQQSSMICKLAAMLEGILFPSSSTWWPKQLFAYLYLVRCLIVTLRCALNVTTSSLQHYFP